MSIGFKQAADGSWYSYKVKKGEKAVAMTELSRQQAINKRMEAAPAYSFQSESEDETPQDEVIDDVPKRGRPKRQYLGESEG